MKTAEWICTKCNTTNRVLVPDNATHHADRCVSCRQQHKIEEQSRPVRWGASAA